MDREYDRDRSGSLPGRENIVLPKLNKQLSQDEID